MLYEPGVVTPQYNSPCHSMLQFFWPVDQATVLFHNKISISSLAEEREQSPDEMSYLQISAQSSACGPAVWRQQCVLILTNMGPGDKHVIRDQWEDRAARETACDYSTVHRRSVQPPPPSIDPRDLGRLWLDL